MLIHAVNTRCEIEMRNAGTMTPLPTRHISDHAQLCICLGPAPSACAIYQGP